VLTALKDWKYIALGAAVGTVAGAVAAALAGEGKSSSSLKAGKLWYGRRRYDKALEAFELAIRADPDNADAHRHAGAAHLALGRNEEALAPLGEAIRLDPARAGARIDMGYALCALGRDEEALEAAEGAVRAEPASPDAHLAQGAVLRSLGRAEETLRCCDRAIALDPGRADARNNRGRALMDLERHEEAVEELDMAIGMDPKSSDAHVNRGIALHRLGRHDEAIMSLRRSVPAGRNDATVWFYIGALLFQTGRLSESLGAVDDAIKIRPDYARAHHARGTVLHCLDRRDEANAAFGRAHELDPAFEVPVLPDEVDDIYVAWHGAMDIRNRLASPTSPGYVMRHQIRSHIAEFLNSAKRALEYHEKQHKSDIVRDYHRLETRTRKYLQYVNETKHERLLDVRIEKTGRRTRVYPNTRTGRPMITIEEGVGLVRDGRNYDISTWPDDMFRGDIDRGFVYEEQVCYVVLRDGEVEVVEFMDTILGGVRGLLERHGYGTSVLANAGPYYGLP